MACVGVNSADLEGGGSPRSLKRTISSLEITKLLFAFLGNNLRGIQNPLNSVSKIGTQLHERAYKNGVGIN
jgi:hypothetical protein